jgi:Fur family transcriptional regulator, ferric uptake regulator
VRGTRQAAALVAALDNLPGFCSAQQIHAELRRRGEHIGLTTVYRHLQVLSEEGSVDAIRDDSGETLYRQCGTSAHHHHLTCRTCGKSVEVEGRAVEQWAERVARDAGFTDVGHTVELFGLCPGCAVLARGQPPAALRAPRWYIADSAGPGGDPPEPPACAPRPRGGTSPTHRPLAGPDGPAR